MNIHITPSDIGGRIIAPPSKSLSHRAIIAAALATGRSKLANVLRSDDIDHTIDALQKLGVHITARGASLEIIGTGGRLVPCNSAIDLGLSGSSMRFLTAVATLVPGITTLTGSPRLCERPMTDIIQPLRQQGISIASLNHNGCPPMEIHGGEMSGGAITVNGRVSSQFTSALLLVAPFAKSATLLRIRQICSEPYINLTISIMKDFGIRIKRIDAETFSIEKGQHYVSRNITIEGDYSSGSYAFAAAAITGHAVTVTNLSGDSIQGDAYFLELLKRMGCRVVRETGRNAVQVKGPQALRAIHVDLKDHPDIAQSLAIVAAFARGTTVITNIGNLKNKESDRLTATVTQLKKMGIDASNDNTSMNIIGGKPKGAVIETYDDHRMAMCFAVAGIAARGETVIQNANVVNKSYPNFFDDLAVIGVKMRRVI